MSIFNDKILKSVAEAASKVMQQEELKGKQHEIDANKNGKIDAHDFKLLRAKKVMKEEVEQLDEVGDTPAGRKALGSYVMKALHDKDRQKGVRKATSRLYKDNYYGKKTNEEVEEQIDEAFPTVADAKKRMDAGKTATGSVTKTATGLVHKRDFEHNAGDDDHPEKVGRPTSYGARQKRNMGTKLYKENFTDMISSIQSDGVKSLSKIFEAEQINEEPDNEQFTKELEDQKASMMGKKKQPSVAAPATQGVKAMAEDVDADDFISEDDQLEEGLGDAVKGAVGVVKNVINKEKAYQAEKQKKAGEVLSKMRREEVELDERTLTKGEAEKKEDYVKGMKKKLSGFKERYGERAKEVMYATATRMAKED
jgi:hypothetical protein